MTPDAVKRYARHLVLKEIGGPGQHALLSARLAIVGAGGLGGPAGLYLAAAGLGHITLIDDDVIEASNLQRQIQFTSADIGTSKASVMAEHLQRLNPDVTAIAKTQRLTPENAKALLAGHDIVLCGVDNFEARFAVNRACLTLGLPHVSGALGRFDGQVSSFGGKGTGPCYRCFVPELPPQAESCAEAGIIGALAGIVGSFMALEAIKIITGAGEPLLGRVWIYDGLRANSRTVSLPRDTHCPDCGVA